MTPLLGTDEAGFGPNLGPLVIVATRWDGPDDLDVHHSDGLRELLSESVSSTPQADRIALADSKAIHKSGQPLAESPLAQSARAVLRVAGHEPRSLREVVTSLDPDRADPLASVPWLVHGADDESPIDKAGDVFARSMEPRGLRLQIVADVIPAGAYNDLLDRYGSKGQLLSRRTLRLLRSLWSVGEPAAIVCDKHGGRDKYAPLLQDVLLDAADSGSVAADASMLFGPAIETECEGRMRSRYRIGESELMFAQQAESHIQVAAASIVAKWIRERAMDAFNAWWTEKRPNLAPTRGYPNDAQRWRAELGDCEIEERLLWRRK